MKHNCSYTELVDIHKIVENPRNTNTHPERQIELLAKIIDFQGQRSPVVVSKRSGFITKGHGRLLAMKKLKWEKVAVDYQDYENEAMEYADLEADNRIAELAVRDEEKARTQIEDILGVGFDFELLGMDKPLSSWDTDIEDEVGKTPKNLDGIPAVIKITCPQEIKEKVRDFLRSKLTESEFQDATIE